MELPRCLKIEERLGKSIPDQETDHSKNFSSEHSEALHVPEQSSGEAYDDFDDSEEIDIHFDLSEPTTDNGPDSDCESSQCSIEIDNTVELESKVYEVDDEQGIGDLEDVDGDHIIDMTLASRGVDDSSPETDSEADLELVLEEVAPTDSEGDDSADSKPKTEDKKASPGTSSSPDLRFCPIGPTQKFAYKFLPARIGEQVADSLFNFGKFWERELDLYYIWFEDEIIPKPIIFITFKVFDDMIEDINTHFTQLELDSEDIRYREIGLVLDFPDHPKLRPRYLGTSTSKDEYQRLISFIPPSYYAPSNEMPAPDPSPEQIADFKPIATAAREVSKVRNKEQKFLKKQAKLRQTENYAGQITRAQRYLGLLAHSTNTSDAEAGESVAPFDCNKPPRFPFDEDLVIIAFDCEAGEDNAKPVTEVGVTSIDTRDIKGLAPGDRGFGWYKHIHARHIRIKEHLHVRNKWCPGNPEKFEYGQSEIVAKNDASSVVATCFRPPFAKTATAILENLQQQELPNEDQAQFLDDTSGFAKMSLAATSDDGSEDDDSSDVDNTPLVPSEHRKVLLIGHAPENDVAYLRQLGYDLANLSNVHEILDTASLWRAYNGQVNPEALVQIMVDLRLSGNPGNPHNAGNDAAYTLMVFLAMVIKMRMVPGGSDAHKASYMQKVQEGGEAKWEEQAAMWEKVNRGEAAQEGN